MKQRRRPAYKRKKGNWFQRKFGWLFSRSHMAKHIIFLVLFGLLILVLTGIVTWVVFASTLASKDSIMNRNKTGVTLLDRNGKPFYEFYNAHSTTYVPLSSIAPIAQKAVIASEDKDFYKEPGFSVNGILRAVYTNLVPGGGGSGGSTITQQLVKNALLSQEQTLLRKYQEIILSVEIERRYTKDQILEMYLNSVYFGEGAFGIEDAARTYFGIPAKDLNLAQASMLIGLLPAPSAYSPISGNAQYAKQRQKYVLGRMQTDGDISQADNDTAYAQALTYQAPKADTNTAAPHFALMVKQALIDKYGEEQIARSGYQVKTTLNLDWQAQAQSVLAAQVSKLQYSKVSNGAVVALDPKTGEVLALVGSVDWNNDQFGKVNMATTTRQPGSSFKPIVYATGIEERDLTPATIFDDKLTDFGGYEPHNYTGYFYGNVTARFALANSLNIPAVLALQKVGIQPVLTEAKALGISTLTDTAAQYGLPLALGSGQVRLTELTDAYATFANSGQYNPVQTILSISDKNNNVIYTSHPQPRTALSTQTSFIISSMLSDNAARSTTFGSSLNLSGGRTAAVKTGTTEDYRDALTVGYTPSLVIGVWMGNNDNTPMTSIAGSVGSAPIWKQLMQSFLGGTPNESFAQPDGVVSLQVCRGTEAIAPTTGTNTYSEYFRASNVPSAHCNATPKEQPKPQTQSTDTTDQTTTQGTQDTTTSGSGSGDGTSNGQTTPIVPPPSVPIINP